VRDAQAARLFESDIDRNHSAALNKTRLVDCYADAEEYSRGEIRDTTSSIFRKLSCFPLARNSVSFDCRARDDSGERFLPAKKKFSISFQLEFGDCRGNGENFISGDSVDAMSLLQ